MEKYAIQSDIKKAATLPAGFYRNSEVFEASKEQIFAAHWNFVTEAQSVAEPGQVYPFTLLEGVLDEPLVLTHDQNGVKHCLSNVCTHRGNLVAMQPGKARMLSCGYHGRCFRLDGTFKSMPAFEGAEDFPTQADHLTPVSFEEWLGLIFVSLNPAVPFEVMTQPIRERLSWLPLDTLQLVDEGTTDYHVNAHWALYCDNFLEGFHIPFVHPALNAAIDFGQYAYEIFPYCNLQIGIADEGQPHFEAPEGHPDFGRKIYAYYYWLFPNLMFNFYPWGLSLNVVEPQGLQKTRIRFRTYQYPGTPHQRSLNSLEATELEDEAVVESVQRGIQSRYYHSGRFSPAMEQGVHHFHSLLAKVLF